MTILSRGERQRENPTAGLPGKVQNKDLLNKHSTQNHSSEEETQGTKDRPKEKTNKGLKQYDH